MAKKEWHESGASVDSIIAYMLSDPKVKQVIKVLSARRSINVSRQIQRRTRDTRDEFRVTIGSNNYRARAAWHKDPTPQTIVRLYV